MSGNQNSLKVYYTCSNLRQSLHSLNNIFVVYNTVLILSNPWALLTMNSEKYLMLSEISVAHRGEPSLPQTKNYPQPLILEYCAPATSSAAHAVHFKRKKVRHKYISWCANELWELGIKTPGNTLDLIDSSTGATEIYLSNHRWQGK